MSLSVQWGYAKSDENVILPIPFANETWKIASMSTTKSYDYTPTVVSKTNRSFEPGSWGLPYDYIAIGFQQWGVVTDDRSTLTFLLPFSNSDYFYAAFPTNKVNTGGINLHGVRNPTYLELYSSISNNSNTANNWQFSGRNINPCWLAVGIQQWGVTTSNSGTITFPLAHKSSVFAVTLFMEAHGTSTIHIYAKSISLDNFVITSAIPQSQFQSFAKAYWISLGV